ncbi:MAG: hypothetical protein AAF739_09435 [Pseudomonadota bacterium]
MSTARRAATRASKTAGSLVDLNFAMWRMGMEASSVIAMRTMGAAGWWHRSDNENEMMVREKQLAFAKGAAQASLAMWQGANPAAVMLEAVKPAKAKTRRNAQRLSRKGPRIPGLSG